MLEKLKQCPFCGGDVKIINAEELTINHHRSGGERVMASCKDCLHVEVCEEYGEVFSLIKGGKCSLFKDRSRFVELPYSLSEGDKLKYIFTDENNEIRIGDDWEVVTKICKDGFFVTGRLNSDGTYQAGDCFYLWSAIGTEYFLTKEEAEQALKEREENEIT